MTLMNVRRRFIDVQRPIQDVNVFAEALVEFIEEVHSDFEKHIRVDLILHVADLDDGFFRAGLFVQPQIFCGTVALGMPGFAVAFVLTEAVVRVALRIKMPLDFFKPNGEILGIPFFEIGVAAVTIPKDVVLRCGCIDVVGLGKIKTAVIVLGVVDAVFAGAAIVAGNAFFCDMHASFLFGFRGPFQFS